MNQCETCIHTRGMSSECPPNYSVSMPNTGCMGYSPKPITGGCLPSEQPFKLPKGWLDWNTLSLDQMVEYLRQKYMIDSSGDAKCIYHLIEFYDKYKDKEEKI